MMSGLWCRKRAAGLLENPLVPFQKIRVLVNFVAQVFSRRIMYPYKDTFPTQKSEDKHYLVESSLMLCQKTSSIKIQDLLLRTWPSGFCYFNQDILWNLCKISAMDLFSFGGCGVGSCLVNFIEL